MTTLDIGRARADDHARARRRSKLIKSLRRFDMVLLHRLRVRRPRHARHGRVERRRRGSSGSSCSAVVFVLPYALLMAEVGLDVHRGGRPVRVDEARLGPLRRRHRRDPLLGHEPALGRRLARVHRDRRLGRERVRASARDVGRLRLQARSSSGSRSASRSSRCATASGSRTSARSCASSRSGFFSITVVVYGIKHGFHGFSASATLTPTTAVFFGARAGAALQLRRLRAPERRRRGDGEPEPRRADLGASQRRRSAC